MEASQAPQLLGSLGCEARLLHPGLPGVLEERLQSLDPASADPTCAAELLAVLAAVLQNACTGRVAAGYADVPQAVMQDCVRLAGAMVTWMAQGGAAGVASATPGTCASLKEFVAAALDLASHAFFSPEWYEQLGPSSYVAAGNAVRGYVRDLAPVALDATEACWRAVEQQLAAGDPTGEELLEACRALFGALFEGLRHLGTTSADRINDPAFPREMRSFAGLNILWAGLSRVLTGLPQEALQQLLNGHAVQSVLRSLLGYLAAEVRAMVASSVPGEYETRLKVSRFWLQHAARVAQAHPAAAAVCWDELASTAAEVYGHIAACAAAAASAAASAGSSSQHLQAQQQSPQQKTLVQMARDLDSAVACKLTSVLAVVLDAGSAGGGGVAENGNGGGGAAGVSMAAPNMLEARLAKLEALAQQQQAASLPAAATGTAAHAASVVPTGAVLLGLALLQRAAHVSPEARAAMGSRLLPWAGVAAAVNLYGLALHQCQPSAAVAPCLEVPHQLAAAALTLLAASAEQQAAAEQQQQQQQQGAGGAAAAGGLDADTFAAGCAVVCNWGSCAHPLLSLTACDVLSTLVQRSEPALGSRLIAAVARLAGLSAAAEASVAAAAAAGTAAAGGGSSGGAGWCVGSGEACRGVARRLQRLLGCLLAAATPQAEPAWREVLARLAPSHQQLHPNSGPSSPSDHHAASQGSSSQAPPSTFDICAAATAGALWGAAAAAAGAHAAAARAGMVGIPPGSGAAAPGQGAVVHQHHQHGGGPYGGVSEQELGARMRQLLGAVRQASALVNSFQAATSAPKGPPTAATAAAAALAQQWLAQLLDCMEVTVAHVRHLGAPALQPAVQEAAGLAVELLQALSSDSSSSNCSSPPFASTVTAVHVAAGRLLARTANSLTPAALAAAVPALTRLAQEGPVSAAADAAAVAAYCNAPPPEALFHALLRSPHAAVMHAALQSQVHVCRTVPQQYAASVRRLFPPETVPTAGTAAAAGGDVPPAQLAAVFKSYMARKVSDEEAAAATAAAAAPSAHAAEGARLAAGAREGCLAEAGLGRPAAPPQLRSAVQRGVEALQTCMATLSLAVTNQSGSDGGCGEGDPMATDLPYGTSHTAPGAPSGQQQLPYPSLHAPNTHSQPGSTVGGPGSGGGGPFSGLIADDNAAMHGLTAAVGGLERCMGALHAAVLAQGGPGGRGGRPADWDQLQAHARKLLGDLSSVTSRIRNMNDLLHALQGR